MRTWAILGVLLGLVAQGQEQAGPTVWGESAMVKVRPQTAPGAHPGVELMAARNEFVSFQVGLHGGGRGWRNVSARLLGLEGPVRIEGADIVLYRQTFLHIAQLSSHDSEPGLWPDGLVPAVDETRGEQRRAFPMDVPPGEARALWVDVHVPMHAPPGEYRGTVEVTGDGHGAQMPVRLTVVPLVMPSTASLRTNFSTWVPNICIAFTGERDCSEEERLRLIQDFLRLAIEHRITLTNVFTESTLPGASGFDAFWTPWLTGTVPSRLPGARLTSLQFPGPFTEEALATFQRLVEERGWQGSALVKVGDEPPYHSTVEEVREKGLLTRQGAPRLRTILPSRLTYLEEQGLTDVIDILVEMVNFLPTQPTFRGSEHQHYAAFLRRPTRELWLYQSCGTLGCDPNNRAPESKPGQGWPSYAVDRSPAKARALEWLSFLEGATGELYYETVHMLSSAWTNQYLYGNNGDGNLFYPGTPADIGGTLGVPLPSIRLKLIRLGIQDYEWLKAVSEAGDPDFARWVARALLPAAWLVPDDGLTFERARLMLIHRYLELTGMAASRPVHDERPHSAQ